MSKKLPRVIGKTFCDVNSFLKVYNLDCVHLFGPWELSYCLSSKATLVQGRPASSSFDQRSSFPLGCWSFRENEYGIKAQDALI